jgi:molybdopterin-containing oxidoreductase family iron-sulfur binding subunit
MKPDTANAPTAAPPAQWQGMDDYLGSPEFLAAVRDEFPEDAAEFADPVSRRRFLGLMGASIALSTGAGCNLRPAPQRQILPYTVQPDQVQPGIPLFFASAAPHGGYGHGVLVRSHEGRPVKVEGNPAQPSSLGGADLYALASVLDLYDQDRSRTVTNRGLPAPYDEAVVAVRRQLYDAQGQPRPGVRLRLLTGAVTSPTLAAQIGGFLAAFPEARWAQHEPAAGDGVREGTRKAFGSPRNVTYAFGKADVVLSLDADFLGCGADPGGSRYNRDFADRRKIRHHGKTLAAIHGKKDEKKGAKKDNGHEHDEGVRPEALNRLYVVEAMPTTTGSVADHRLALPSSQVEAFARALARRLGVAGAPAGGESFDAHPWVAPLAADLQAKREKSVVVAGDRQPAAVHALVAAINAALGNVGKTVFYSAPVESRPDGKVIDLKTLVGEMAGLAKETEQQKRGSPYLLLVLGSNPAYTAPADVPFADTLRNVPFTLHLGTHVDETGVLCHWHVNEAHYLEAWGDVRGHDGTATVQQPLIAPLFQGKSAIELLAAVADVTPTQPGAPTPPRPRDGLDVVRAYWSKTDEVKKAFPGFTAPETFEVFWQEAVRSGVVAGTGPVFDAPGLAGNWAADAPAPAAAPSGDAYEIDFRPDPTVYDGRYANNGWLQELPKPVTKLTWDNAAFVSPKTAEKLSVDKTFRWTGGEHGRAEVTVLELKHRGRTVKAPAWVLPNHPDGVVTVHLGYGRGRAGSVASTPAEPNAAGEPVRGFNAYALRTADAPWFAPGLAVSGTKDTYFLACTQGQTSMQQTDPINGHVWDRKPVRHGDLALYKQNPAFAKIPPMAAGETDPINRNVPGPQRPKPDPDSGAQDRRGSEERPHDHSHGKDGKDAGHGDHAGHDHRLVPLTMYHPNDALIPGWDKLVERGQARRWGMAIDLSACTGCSACVVACQGENNSPVVGKEQVTKGRAMHWIRIDRYYEGAPGDPGLKTLFQPLMCVHCEKAPCEIVCPVGATVHSYDGMNDMVYNRCVGTRYCSNNCPYKVRRFNFLQYQDFSFNVLNLGRNPDVTVRSRGVMEKCTFCNQRVRGAEIVAEREFRRVRDGEVLTACQSACPAGAIVFGDLADPESTVSEWKAEPHNYGLLAELNTMPRLTHLAVVRNPNPAMPKGA